MGARSLWKKYLPTLQFYNPDFKIDVVRIKNPDKKKKDIPCTLDIIANDGKVIDTLDMRNKMYDDIMDQLLEKIDHNVIPEENLIKIEPKIAK